MSRKYLLTGPTAVSQVVKYVSMIAISLSPNTEKDDVFLALKVLFQPWRWIEGRETREVEEWFGRYFPVSQAVCFNSGRSALYALLKCFGIGSGDEVLLQAFTCVAVPNSVLWVGAKPVFVDIEKKTYNLDPVDLEKKITKNSKAVIVQNTFGLPAKIEKIKEIVKKHGLILIEDGAHSLGGFYESGEKVGSVGEFAFFSFGSLGGFFVRSKSPISLSELELGGGGEKIGEERLESGSI